MTKYLNVKIEVDEVCKEPGSFWGNVTITGTYGKKPIDPVSQEDAGEILMAVLNAVEFPGAYKKALKKMKATAK
jgi:hypothetical protein